MNNHLKRRRPFGHDEGAEGPGILDTQRFQNLEGDLSSLSSDIRLRLQDAASIYGISVHRLHQLGLQEQSRKRQRLGTGFTMSQPYASISHDDQSSTDEQHGGSSSVAFSPHSSRFTNSLVTLKSMLCQTCSDKWDHHENYEPVPSFESFPYGPSKPYGIEKPPSLRISSGDPFGAADVKAMATTSAFAVGEPGLAATYLEDFSPVQQQSQSILTQPQGREVVPYPNSSQIPDYLAGQPLSRDLSDAYLPNHVITDDPVSVGFGSTALPYGQRPGPAAGGSESRYAVMQPYGPPEPVQHSRGADAGTPNDHPEYHIVFAHHLGRPPTARRGPFKNNDDREKTAQTRKIGSCVRCRMQRIRCKTNPDEPTGACLTCQKVLSNTKIWRLPCLRYKITDVQLFKPCEQVQGFEWTQRWSNSVVDNITSWASPAVRTIHVSEGYTTRPVELRVREFVPQEGDKLERSWVHGGLKRSVPIPPYAIVNLQEAQNAYSEYISRGVADCFNSVVVPRDGLLWRTYDLAWRTAQNPDTPLEERELLLLTLRLWMAVRVTTKSTIIVGKDTLGMPHNIMDETSPIQGSIPLPPVMGAQLDLILIDHIQKKLRRDLLEKLQKMTQTNKQKTWLTTYLATFILLHNIALITEHDANYARKHDIKRRYAREHKVKEYHMGANILLAYFHYCNKGIFPFSPGCKDQDLRSLAELDESKIRFVKETRQYVHSQKGAWEQLQQDREYEDGYFFVSQLFEQNWQPRVSTT